MAWRIESSQNAQQYGGFFDIFLCELYVVACGVTSVNIFCSKQLNIKRIEIATKFPPTRESIYGDYVDSDLLLIIF